MGHCEREADGHFMFLCTLAPVLLRLIKMEMDPHIQKSPAVIYVCGAVEIRESSKMKTLFLEL